MAAVIGLAASATEATGERFGIFVGCQLLLRASLLLQYRRAYRHIEHARPIARLYLVGTGVGRGAVDGLPARAPAGRLRAVGARPSSSRRWCRWSPPGTPPTSRCTSSTCPSGSPSSSSWCWASRWPASRTACTTPTWTPSAIPVAVLAFVLAAALWWSYFDLAGARAKQLLNEAGGEHSDRAARRLRLRPAAAHPGAGHRRGGHRARRRRRAGRARSRPGPGCCSPAASRSTWSP